MLLATINQRAGAPIFGAPARQVRAFAGADDVADLIAAVHSAPPGLKVSAYVEIVGQARARRGLQMSAPLRPEIVEWREALPDEDSAPPPWRGTGQSGLDWAVASCETATGGAQ